MLINPRRELKGISDLGEFGAAAIRRALVERGVTPLPTILANHRPHPRATRARPWTAAAAYAAPPRPAPRVVPPRTWPIRPGAELDSFDIVEGLAIKGGTPVEVLNGIALHGGLTASWPDGGRGHGQGLVRRGDHGALVSLVGLPGYAQFDNDTIFQGPHQYKDVIGRVMRACLGLGVVPVFLPHRETGFQASTSAYNGRWQAKVWCGCASSLRWRACRPSRASTWLAVRLAAVPRRGIEAAPSRRPFPAVWKLNLKKRPRGRLIYLRRSNGHSEVTLLGQSWPLGQVWPNRLVRCEVDLDKDKIRFFTLRRKEPTSQPQILEVDYRLPNRGFQD